ncbi:hypothetical protein CsSME_00004464 [Camellia sinensis var. sinensis]
MFISIYIFFNYKITSHLVLITNLICPALDVFIPFKRRKVTNSRFGFVRFDCPVVADIAIQKANGLLVDDKVLDVKTATFDRRSRKDQIRRKPQFIRKPQPIRRPLVANRSRSHVLSGGHRSFADVSQGVTSMEAGKASTTIKVTEEGNCWLFGIAIICLNAEYSILSIIKALKEKGFEHIMVKKGGGRDVILTFNSQKELKSNIDNLKDWFKDWSQFVVEWNLWGSILNLEGDIYQPKSYSHAKIRVATSSMEFIHKTLILECKGKSHSILVCEDHLPDYGSLKQ